MDTVQLNASLMHLTKAEQKEAAGIARRLFQYHRLSNKTSRDILVDI
jgi:predicted secreted Zn-dependent protease